MKKRLEKISSKLVKRICLVIVGGIIFGVIGVQAANMISSSDVIYDNTNSGASSTTVQDAIDELYDELLVGKEKIADAITNKGVETTTDNTFEEMADNIDLISGTGIDYSAISESVVANTLDQVGTATFSEAIVGHTYLILFVNISAWVNNSTMVGTVASGADILYTSSVVRGNTYRDAGYGQYIICKATDTTITLTLTSFRPAYSITDLSL